MVIYTYIFFYYTVLGTFNLRSGQPVTVQQHKVSQIMLVEIANDHMTLSKIRYGVCFPGRKSRLLLSRYSVPIKETRSRQSVDLPFAGVRHKQGHWMLYMPAFSIHENFPREIKVCQCLQTRRSDHNNRLQICYFKHNVRAMS